MFERMLNKETMPAAEEMTAFCGETGALFTALNRWLDESCKTEPKTVFPYGNGYGWCVAHRKKGKLLCNVFAEDNAFTVMLRLSDAQCASVYAGVGPYTRQYIDNKYPCGDGGWIHYRVTDSAELEDVKKLLALKA